MITWSQDTPSFTFNGTDAATNTALLFTLVRQGAGPTYTAELKKNGATQGTMIMPTLDAARDLFTICAANI